MVYQKGVSPVEPEVNNVAVPASEALEEGMWSTTISENSLEGKRLPGTWRPCGGIQLALSFYLDLLCRHSRKLPHSITSDQERWTGTVVTARSGSTRPQNLSHACRERWLS